MPPTYLRLGGRGTAAPDFAEPPPTSLCSLHSPTAAADAVQTFPLPADLPLGRYLRVNLHSKRQQQLEDMQVRWRGEVAGAACWVLPAVWCSPSGQLPPFHAARWEWRRRTLPDFKRCVPGAATGMLQWYHAIQRVEAFGSQLAAGDVACLRDWTARLQRPLPAPGAVPSYVATALLGEQQAVEGDGEQEEQQLREGGPAGEELEEQRGPGLGAAPEEGEAGRQQPAAAAAAGIMRQQSLESTTSSLSFTG